ncbi:MAG: hypothetical protein HGN29_07380 [Asgard group archaeon]|nr:hypothetical protein [Asgard group archaeon]
MKNNNTILITVMLISFIILSGNSLHVSSITTLARLTLQTEPGEHFDYALYISKYLESIDIEVQIQVQEEGWYDNLLTLSNDSDLAILEIEQEQDYSYGDILEIYSEEGMLGNFGWSRSIPYCNQSEQLLMMINETENEQDKSELINDWMIIVMDNILPVLPLFIPRNNLSIILLVFNLQRPFIGGDSNYLFLSAPDKESYTIGVAIRKAISYCIDKEEMNNIVND